MGGGKGGDATDNPYAGVMAKMGKEIFSETDPMRTSIINSLGGFMGLTDPMTMETGLGKNKQETTFDWLYDKYGSTNFPSQYSPVYNAAKSGIENSYTQGKNNLIGTLPGGGAKIEALSNLEGQRMGNYSNLNSSIATDLYNKAYGLATGVAPSQASNLLGSASGTYQSGLNTNAMSAAQQQSSLMQMFGSLGTGAGMMAGGKSGGK
jgi:hypothetical protein